jgi:hypothetical protein
MDGPDHLRVGDAERDAVTAALHEHFTQGRLTREELDERLTATLSAKTVGDLRAITADLPPVPGLPAGLAGSPAYTGAPTGYPDGPWSGPGGPPGSGPAGKWPAHASRPWGPPARWGPWGPVGWRRSDPRRRGPRPPLFPLVAAGLIAAAVAGFWVLKYVVLICLVVALVQLILRWRHHSRGPRW